MTDAEYLYQTTNRERARLSHGSRSKVNGSKSKKCSLPSDRLTKKQREMLNGEMVIYEMNKPVTWREFKLYPIEIQKEYIESLIVKYGVAATDIAKMMRVDNSYLSKWLKNTYGDKNPLIKKGRRKKDLTEWYAFLGVEKPSEEFEGETVKEPTEVNESEPESTQRVKLEDRAMFSIENGSISLSGLPHATLAKFVQLLEPDKEYNFSISFYKKALDSGDNF